jgi:hypothetical protein
MEFIPQPGQGPGSHPGAEFLEPLVTSLADEFDPDAAIRHRGGKRSDARKYAQGAYTLNSRKKSVLESITHGTRASRLNPAFRMAIRAARLLWSASVRRSTAFEDLRAAIALYVTER